MQILKKITMLAFLLSAFAVGAMAQLTGTKNVPGDYATVAAAVTDLNTNGVGAGGVTFVVADGYTETAPAGGFTITNPTGNGAGNPIVFRRATSAGTRPAFTANAALTAGSLTDAIFKIVGTDNVTIDGFSMLENAANTVTTAASNTMNEFGVALFYATATNGSQNVTVQNCVIDLDRTYQNTFGIYSNSTHSATAIATTATATTTDGGNSGLKIYGNSITDVNTGIVVVGPTASADNNDGVDIGGAALATGNSITNYGTTGTFSGYANVSGTVNGILVRNTKNFNVSFNSLASSVGGVTAGTLRGVYVPAFTNAPTGTIVNSINNNNISLRSGVAGGAMLGIVNEGTTVSVTTTLNINNNDFLNFGHTVSGTAAITFISQAAATLTTNINANTFTNMSVNTTGSVTFITNSVTHPAGSATSVSNNSVVTAFSKTGAGGTVFFYDSFGSTTSGTETNTGNNFSNMTFTGATTISGFRSADGASPFPSKTVTNNTFNNITGGTSGITILTVGFSPPTPASNVSGNVISNISGGGAVLGITSSAGTQNFFSNTINTLASTGAAAVTGMSITGGVTQSVYKNKIYDLSGSNAGSFVAGLTISTIPTTANVYNNLIGDLRATAATSTTDSVRGINITGTTALTTLNVSFNTVYLNAASTGANFSTSALFATISATATSATLNLRNNILVNLSTPAGTGTTSAYRRSAADLTNYGSVSNNNDFFAGTPSATNVIFFDGTNSDQTLAAYKARVATRDSASVTENPNFLSTTGSNANFLHISVATPTQLESGGIPVSGITDDFDSQARNAATPDIGADEFTGTAIDLNPPAISYTAFGSTTTGTNRTLTVTITDSSGVAGGANSPRIYFRKNGGAYFSTQCTGTAPTYTCTIDYTLVGGVVTNDVIDYFVVAQDVNGNVGANPSGGFSATSVNSITTPPTTPNTYTIVSGFATSVNVGAGETYTGLTTTGGVFAALNAAVLTNNVTINVTSDLTLETGAVALNQLNEEGAGAGTYTVTIKPTGAARIISGTNATGAIIRLNGADRVTINGSLTGALGDGEADGTIERALTITNNSTATGTAAIQIASAGVNLGATNNSVRNTNLSCGADQTTSVNVTYGISHGGTLLGNGGADNDNNSFVNNLITKVNIGIYSSGENAANPVQNTVIANNIIGPAAFGSDQIGRAGIVFNQSNATSVTNNEVRFVGVTDAQTSTGGSYDKFGITHAFNGWSDTLTGGDLAVSNSTIARNRVHDIVEENTFSAVGIFMAGGNGTNDTLNQTVNNFIWNVRANGTSGDNGVSLGIASGKGDTVAYNSIYMAGDIDPLLAAASSTASYGIQIPNTTVVNLNLKNNIAFVDLTSSSTTTLVNAVIRIPTGFVWGTGGSNYNDLYAPAANTQMIIGRVGTTDAPTLAAYQTASGQEANSKSVDPLFISATDLHLQAASTVRASATPIAGITSDIDGDTRNPNTPDMGADEVASFVFPTVQFSGAAYTGAEGTTATVTVNRTGDTTVASTVNYATSNGTATGGAACGAGVDYQNASGTLSFAAGETTKTFTVTICSDALSKGDETVNLTLSTPSGSTLGTPSTAVLTITNVNAPLPGVLALSSATYTIGEAGGTATITVNRTGGTAGAVSVAYALSGGTATGGATCAAGVDYVNTGGTVNFAAGEATKTFTVAICNDTTVESSETFNVTLSGATGGATVGSPATAVVTITDDDVAQNGTVQFSAATYTVTEAGPTATITITRTGGSDGSITVNYATVAGGTATGAAACAAGVDYVNTNGTVTFGAGVTTSQTFTVPVCNDTVTESSETVNLALTNATGGATLGTPNTAVLTITDDDVAGGLSGSVNVGTGQTYTSLTNAGGAFEALNTLGATGNVTFNITSDLTGETGAVALNEVTGGFTVTIKPSGAARTISGTSAASSGVIILNATDNVTIDGSLSGGTDRSLTITNATTTSVVIWMRSVTTNGATGNTVKNTNLAGSVAANIIAGVLTGGSTFGAVATAANSNNTIQNNNIIKAQNALFISGVATTFDQNWVITDNLLGSTVASEKLSFRGMLIGNSQNFVISRNTIVGVNSLTTSTSIMNGIQVATNANGGLITRNSISDIKQTNTSGFGAAGITLGQANTTANITVANNFISDVAGVGFNGVGANDNGYGITVASGGGYKIYFNSVNLATSQTAVGSITAAVNIIGTATGVVTAGSVDLRNNILANTQTVGTRFGVLNSSTQGAAVFADINYNDYFAQNVGRQGTTAYPTLAEWQTATGKDANSQAVDPLFVSATNLHLQATSPLLDDGTPIAGITDDFDGETRSATTPDIGADEIVGSAPQNGTLALSAATYTVAESATSLTVTVNRTSGTSGAVTVNYTLGGGTATGGAACAAGIDYVNTGGTVNFANGEATKTFTVTLCPDTLNKADETFNVTLSGATGGATIGTPATAVVTITNDDPQPTISISDVSQNEGNSGTTPFVFTVSLSAASGQTVTVNYSTADGTASAGSDYTAIPNTVLTFAPGETTKTVTVSVNGDTTVEPNETFNVNLATPTNATIADPQGIGTIVNDDVVVNLGTYSINDVSVMEGNSGTVNVTFTVTLTNPNGQPSSVQYATANGTATAGSDYSAVSGTLNFAAGEVIKTVTVAVNGDTVREPYETFFVNLTNPIGATIADGQGLATIIDDERTIVSDFDRDRKTDFSVFHPSNGYWYVLQSSNNLAYWMLFGINGDVPVPGDYDGDGATDLAVFRPSNGTWYILRSSDNALVQTQFGLGTDKTVQGDYDGDGKTDIAVFRPSNGAWYVLRSGSGNQFTAVNFGASGDVPVQGDYDNDMKTDYAVYRNGVWYVLNSANGAVTAVNFGTATDKPLVGDFDGDGRSDYTVYRAGVWYIFQSRTNTSRAVPFGVTTDVPVVGDYDRDGTADVAVWRPANGMWYLLQSSNGAFNSAQFGQAGDIPIPAAYQSLQ